MNMTGEIAVMQFVNTSLLCIRALAGKLKLSQWRSAVLRVCLRGAWLFQFSYGELWVALVFALVLVEELLFLVSSVSDTAGREH